MKQRRDPYPVRWPRFQRACWWLSRGVEIVPLKPRSKHIQPGYGPHRAQITDVSVARKWFLNTDANLGVVLGKDAGLVVGDWDTVEDYLLWRETAGADVNTLTEKTGRGFHLFFFGKNLRSAAANGCEFKASGVCMVTPSVHPSGAIYRIENDAPIQVLDETEAYVLFSFLSKERNRQQGTVEKNASSQRTDRRLSCRPPDTGGVVVRIKAAYAIIDELAAAGVSLQPGGRCVLVGLCPFHDDHSPSLWVNPESGLWGCNQPRCPAAGVHDVINFRAWRRGISNSEAIRELARECL